ncbi:MAG TPA: 30S ribosomal protein S20 [Blastocatellia bacterium]|nr:30S ribosomal protein S20 [Blastocatellia bacterium]
MPRTQSAIRQMRKNERRREINRRNRSRLRTAIKKLRAALQAGAVEEAKQLLPRTLSIIDNSVHKGILHRNAAARYKSRLMAHVHRLIRASSTVTQAQ